MQRFAPADKRILALSLIFVALFAAFVFFPGFYRSQAVGSEKIRGASSNRTQSHKTGLENYDIRLDKSNRAIDSVQGFRRDGGKDASELAVIRAGFVDGEKELSTRIPSLKVEYNNDLHIPEVITPKSFGGNTFLSGRSNAERSDILREFVRDNSSLVGLDPFHVDDLRVTADYSNPSGSMSFAHLEQRINDIPVFRGEIKAGFTKNGEIVRVINNLAPGLNDDSISYDFGDPLAAVRAAAGHIEYKLRKPDVTRNDEASDDLKTVYGEGDWATTAEKIYFPSEIGVVRPAWRVLIWRPVNAFYVIVDAETGTMLWRKNITEDQTQTATYEVYNNTLSYAKIAESPAPLTPGPTNPGLGTQGPLLTRSNVTLIGNEAPNTFNNKGWIDDGNNSTAGNNTIAGLDIDGINGVDAPVVGSGRVFSSAWNPPPGNPPPGDAPTVTAARNGAVIQMFYAVNRYHDALYLLGFTEAARNFQNDNFSRGGIGNDRVSSEGQDSSGTNNANFSSPADGNPGRMQMYIFTAPNPDRDGTADADIIVHELTHGTSNRLHGNSGGLSLNMSRGMGEGWSDWYAHVLTSESGDPINGVYTTGGYVQNTPTNTANFYYGIRRFPKAVLAFTGGPGNRPHNPLTFADLNSGCNISDGAFPPAFSGTCDQVHNAGEIWSSALWEVRSLMVSRMGFQIGTETVLQVVTDGMKLAPLNPTYLQERDAILAAARANANSADPSADVADVWEGFRIRGMGFSAKIVSAGQPAVVTEAFDPPNVVLANPGFLVSDAPGDNDTFPEPGESLLLTVPIVNNTGKTVNNVAVNVNGGPNVSYGNIADGTTVSKQIPYIVPAGTPCGSSINLNINISGSVGPRTEIRTIIIGQPNPPLTENFDGVTEPALPAGWGSSQTGAGVAFVTKTGAADSAPNSVFTPNTGLNSSFSGAILDSIGYPINAQAGVISFRNNYNTELGWDGGALEISINAGAFQDIITAGGRFLEGGYNDTIGTNSSPLDGREAWTGSSGGYLTTRVQLPASANGQTVKFRWRFGEDDNTTALTGVPGWNVDSVQITTAYTCNFTLVGNTKFDFDGDRRTDISIFRPSMGQWWLLRSSDLSNAAFNFGTSTDIIAPADYTGDGITDITFWRESTGEWFVLRSEDFSFYAVPFGTAGDIPAPGDFDGDGMADTAIYRPSTSAWWIQNSSGGTTVQGFGLPEDKPVVGDYDGDGRDDIAIYRPSNSQWWQFRSQEGVVAYQFGTAGDKTVQGDYTGDGRADVAFFRPSDRHWYVLRSEDSSFYAVPFGLATDIPTPGDYDGDGKADTAVFRPSNSTWYVDGSTSGFFQVGFGQSGDIPVPNAYVRQ